MILRLHCIVAARCVRLGVIVADRLPKIMEERPFELNEVQQALAFALRRERTSPQTQQGSNRGRETRNVVISSKKSTAENDAGPVRKEGRGDRFEPVSTP